MSRHAAARMRPFACRVFDIERPDLAVRARAAVRGWGASPAAGYAV